MVRKKAISSTIGHIHIKDINLYDDKVTQHITFDTPLDVRENITVKQNLSTDGTEDITHKDNTKQIITYTVTYDTASKNIHVFYYFVFYNIFCHINVKTFLVHFV